jgi:uncharacterized protein HemX
MPYASDAQRKYFNANKAKLESQGVDVDEYNQASKGMKLPEHTNSAKKKTKLRVKKPKI